MQPGASVIPRRWKRHSATIPINLVLTADHFKRDYAAFTMDISLCGMCVRTALALAPGEWVGVIDKGEFSHAMPTRVVWVREDESSRWTFAGLEYF